MNSPPPLWLCNQESTPFSLRPVKNGFRLLSYTFGLEGRFPCLTASPTTELPPLDMRDLLKRLPCAGRAPKVLVAIFEPGCLRGSGQQGRLLGTGLRHSRNSVIPVLFSLMGKDQYRGLILLDTRGPAGTSEGGGYA